ncbi:MAG: hypothetical protein D6722_24690, partial [Bacteroidetes bacterium]
MKVYKELDPRASKRVSHLQDTRNRLYDPFFTYLQKQSDPPLSARARIVEMSRYFREGETSSDEVFARVLVHQARLWEAACGEEIRYGDARFVELCELGLLLKKRVSMLAGRTLWLGGTDKSAECEATQFNCCHIVLDSPQALREAMWLLLQGCGVGGTLPSSTQGCTIQRWVQRPKTVIVPSKRGPTDKGDPSTTLVYDDKTQTLHLQVGDSAIGWADAVLYILSLIP